MEDYVEGHRQCEQAFGQRLMSQTDFAFIWFSVLFLALDALMITCAVFLFRVARNTRKHSQSASQKVSVADPSADADVYFGKRLSQLRQPFGVPMKREIKPNE